MSRNLEIYRGKEKEDVIYQRERKRERQMGKRD